MAGQSSPPMPQPKGQEAKKEQWLIQPRPPKGVLEPEEATDILRQIVKNFMNRHNVYEIRRMWLRYHGDTNFIQLKGDVDLYISSHMKRLIVAGRDRIETIIFTARKGKKILDEVEVHVDISLEEVRKIEDVWIFIRRYIFDDKQFCLEDHVEFDSDIDDLYGIQAVVWPGFEIYSRQACHVLAQHGIDEEEDEE